MNNSAALQDIISQIRGLEDDIPGLNRDVCGVETTRDRPCDDLCGGAGCGKCGGLSCQSGALRMAQEAVESAELTQVIISLSCYYHHYHVSTVIFMLLPSLLLYQGILNTKEEEAEEVLREIVSLNNEAKIAADAGQQAFDDALEAKDR